MPLETLNQYYRFTIIIVCAARVRYQRRRKLQFNLKVFSVARVLPKGRGGYIHAKVVTTTLNAYMASADRRLGVHHVPNSFNNNQGHRQMLDNHSKMVRETLIIPGMPGFTETMVFSLSPGIRQRL